jgi:hypothetical protein
VHFVLDIACERQEHIANNNAVPRDSEGPMTFISATLFLIAFALSFYAVWMTVVAHSSRITDVVVARGMPVERVIHLGAVRYTGRRMRLVSESNIAPAIPFKALPSLCRAAA